MFGLRKRSANEALRSQLKAHAEFGRTGRFWRNEVIARNVLDEDLGQFENPPMDYGDDPSTLTRLAAHARQDAAHALLNTNDLLIEIMWLRRLVGVAVILLALIVWKLFA